MTRTAHGRIKRIGVTLTEGQHFLPWNMEWSFGSSAADNLKKYQESGEGSAVKNVAIETSSATGYPKLANEK